MRACGHRGRAALQALSRSELQVLAKREGIKANLKSELIVNRLLQKYPEGYPRSSAPSPELSVDKGAPLHQTVNAIETSRTQYTPAAGQSNGHVADDGHPGNATTCGEPGIQTTDLPRPELKPEMMIVTKKNLRFIRREMTELVDETGHLQDDLDDLERVLQMNLNDIDAMVRDANELVWMRVGIEVHIANKMKQDRTVWDGTLFMSKSSRRKWMQHVQNNNRVRGGVPFGMSKRTESKSMQHAGTDENEWSGDEDEEYDLYSIQS
ncbi:hypothetical protein APHAL10511_004784 [Amanita phalloides]|nr:hypothetical protein APHAL10511_004784 [Amanita phalloides]